VIFVTFEKTNAAMSECSQLWRTADSSQRPTDGDDISGLVYVHTVV